MNTGIWLFLIYRKQNQDLILWTQGFGYFRFISHGIKTDSLNTGIWLFPMYFTQNQDWFFEQWNLVISNLSHRESRLILWTQGFGYFRFISHRIKTNFLNTGIGLFLIYLTQNWDWFFEHRNLVISNLSHTESRLILLTKELGYF